MCGNMIIIGDTIGVIGYAGMWCRMLCMVIGYRSRCAGIHCTRVQGLTRRHLDLFAALHLGELCEKALWSWLVLPLCLVVLLAPLVEPRHPLLSLRSLFFHTCVTKSHGMRSPGHMFPPIGRACEHESIRPLASRNLRCTIGNGQLPRSLSQRALPPSVSRFLTLVAEALVHR